MIKALLAPYVGYLYATVILLVAAAAYCAYDAVYDRGYNAAQIISENEKETMRKANAAAIASAEKGLREDVAALVLQKKELENALSRLNADADKDPHAHDGGIKRSSVQRLNANR